MLIDIYSGATITYVPHLETFNPLQERLSQDEFDAIVEYINELIDGVGAEIATAGWLPENEDWTGTPLQPIYDTAARRHYNLAGKMYGLMVWYTVMQRPEQWASGKFEKNGIPIESRTYFRVSRM